MQEYQFPKSRQQRDFENLCKSIMKIMSDLQEEQQNDLHEYALQLWEERNDRTHTHNMERKEVTKMKYEVIPQNGRKSFYGKAIVTEENGNKVLTSYTTDVARIDAQGKFTRLWNGYSVTTMNHVNAFRIMNGLQALSKKEWESM